MMQASSSLLSGSAMARRSAVACAPVQRRALVIQNAHKMGAGSTKNGRNSNAQRRGIKVFGGQPVKAGGIIYRQVGTTWHEGTNTALGKDFTVFSLVEGVVVYDKKKDRSVVHVYPFDHVKAQAAIKATHTKAPKEGVPSRQERRKAMYKPRNPEKAALAVATIAASVKP